jgi:hypothetical protein
MSQSRAQTPKEDSDYSETEETGPRGKGGMGWTGGTEARGLEGVDPRPRASRRPRNRRLRLGGGQLPTSPDRPDQFIPGWVIVVVGMGRRPLRGGLSGG